MCLAGEDALNHTGRPMVHSLAGWQPWSLWLQDWHWAITHVMCALLLFSMVFSLFGNFHWTTDFLVIKRQIRDLAWRDGCVGFSTASLTEVCSGWEPAGAHVAGGCRREGLGWRLRGSMGCRWLGASIFGLQKVHSCIEQGNHRSWLHHLHQFSGLPHSRRHASWSSYETSTVVLAGTIRSQRGPGLGGLWSPCCC